MRAVSADLRARPPLVFAGEVDSLRAQMAAASQGRAFVLMGGDCAESFADNTADNIRLKLQTILQMAAVLTYGASTPVVKMGRSGRPVRQTPQFGRRDARWRHPARLSRGFGQ